MVLTQNLERILHDMVTENAELQQQLQSSEGEKQIVRQQLMRKEAELTRAEETIRSEQQLVEAKDRELAQAQQQLREQVSFHVKLHIIYFVIDVFFHSLGPRLTFLPCN